MSDRVARVVAALESFEPQDETDNVWQLYQLFDGFRALPGREAAMPAMFALMERYPEADLGSPGPLVQELEAIGGYGPLLAESVARQPTDLSVWMAGRLARAGQGAGPTEPWRAVLQDAAEHPLAPDFVQASARHFLALSWQAPRSLDQAD